MEGLTAAAQGFPHRQMEGGSEEEEPLPLVRQCGSNALGESQGLSGERKSL